MAPLPRFEVAHFLDVPSCADWEPNLQKGANEEASLGRQEGGGQSGRLGSESSQFPQTPRDQTVLF